MELENKRQAYVKYEMLETMRSLKEVLKSLKVDNAKLLRAKSKQEELNELLLKNMTDKE